MMRHWFCFAVIAASAPHASAQPAGKPPAAPVDKTKARTARQYVDAGLAAQTSGDYDTAITLYQKAYELVPHPVLIFNMAQATRLAGRADDALALYNKYLAADPTGAQAQTARDLVAELNTKKAEADAARAAQAKQADDAREADAARQADAARVAPAPTGPAPVPASPEVEHEGRGLRLTGITVGAIGVVGVGLGIGFALHGKSLQQDVEQRFDPSKVDAGHTANTLALVGAIGGGALIATGVTLYVLGHRKATEHVALGPWVSPRVAGLALSGGW